MISLLEEVSGYEPRIPQMCSPDANTLQPRANNVCMRRVVRADQISLTDDQPNLEYSWKVSGLNNGQVDMMSIVGGTHR